MFMNVGEFATLVENMRTAQKKYFRTHSSDALRESKDWKRAVDDALEQRKKRLAEQMQPVLFGGENV